MPDLKSPLSTSVTATAFNGSKGVVTVPDAANYIEVIAEGVDCYVALRDTAVNTTDDGRNSVNLDTSPENKAILCSSVGGLKYDFNVPGGKRTLRSGSAAVFPETRARMRGFLHYKPTGAAGTGRLIVNFYQ